MSTSTLIIFWQFILKGLDELSLVTNQILSLEMLIIRLIHLVDMPSYEKVLDKINKDNHYQMGDVIKNPQDSKKILKEEKEMNKISKDQMKNTIQTKPNLNNLDIQKLQKEKNFLNISTFEDLIHLSSSKREVELKYELENNVNLIKFSEGKIDISLNENLGKNFVRNLSEKLLEWTGKRWVITLSKKPGQESFSKLKDIKEKEKLKKEKESEVYKKFKNIFSDAELMEVKKNEE